MIEQLIYKEEDFELHLQNLERLKFFWKETVENIFKSKSISCFGNYSAIRLKNKSFERNLLKDC